MTRWPSWLLAGAALVAAAYLLRTGETNTALLRQIDDRLGLTLNGAKTEILLTMTQYSTTIDCPALGGPTTITTTCASGESIEDCWTRHKRAVAEAQKDCAQ